MSAMSKSRLLATSAIAGLSILQFAAPASAQDQEPESFGIHNDQPEMLDIIVEEDEEIVGADIGVYADNGPVTVDNAGAIYGSGDNPGGADSRPSGGVVIAQAGSSITNSGEISGAANGVVTSYFFSEDENDDELPPEPRAADTVVVNSGLIAGEAGAGVSLTGGGSVTNDGTIRGLNGTLGNGAQGIGVALSEFPDAVDADATGVGSITNGETGLIEGQTFGAVLVGGGTIDNQGTIRTAGAPMPGATAVGVVLSATDAQTGRAARLDNDGSVSGVVGVVVGGALDSVTIDNGGSINGFGVGIFAQSTGELIVHNAEDALLTGGGSAITMGAGTLTLDNAGTIRGNGQHGIALSAPGASIANSGTIEGAQSGILTSEAPDQSRPADTAIENSGLIRGGNGNGVGLLGGGSLVNSGTIQGAGGQGNGVVIAEFAGAEATGVTGIGSIVNDAEGLIEGPVFGVVLSGGGTIENHGTIRSTGQFNPAAPPTATPFGIVMTATPEQEGRGATLTNDGLIQGFFGVLAGGSLETVTIGNDGIINGQSAAIVGQSTGDLVIDNGEDGQILAGGTAITANISTLHVENAGLIQSQGYAINIATADAVIVNSGTINGGANAIVTVPLQTEPGVFVHSAVNTSVTNSGEIAASGGVAVRLVGGGSVTNSGTITGGGTADGVSIAAYDGQDLSDVAAIGTITNAEGGAISGVRYGAILFDGGVVDNDGTLTGGAGGLWVQGNDPAADKVASVTNAGTISGGSGLTFGNLLASAELVNSGTITGSAGHGVANGSVGRASITNEASGTITGATSGVYDDEGGIDLVNAGTIRGEGSYDGFDAPPDAGVTILGAPSTVVNSGTISGAGAGITTAYYFNPATALTEGRAMGTTVENSGTIVGESNDGVRLIGGGSVANSGTISGTGRVDADGVSMYAYADQAGEDYSALVTNAADGTIEGGRFGIILSGGGEVENAGAITGVNGGVYIQGTALDSDDRSGVTGSLVNSGTIRGTGDFGGSDGDGYGVGFGSDMASATLDNSGDIASDFGVGVLQGSLADVTVINAEGGTITGATSGIYSNAEGTLAVVNAGTIRGEGSYDGFDAAPDAGITIGTASSSVTNSGTISGAGAGITTSYLYDAEIGQLVGLAVGTTVENSGTIAGESNDGVRLIGGGSVANSGTIDGAGRADADGISIYAFEGQASEDYAALVTNDAGGSIAGERFGIILSGGGDVTNAGEIAGVDGGLFIQGTALDSGERSGLTASVVNSGTITGSRDDGVNGYGVGFGSDLASASLENSGTIASAAGTGFYHGTLGAVTVDNQADGVIEGAEYGVYADGEGTLALVNSGTIRSAGTGVESLTQTNLVNAGTIAGEGGVAVRLGAFDDSVTLKTGSAIAGLVDAGDGVDSLVLDGDVLELTEAQQIGAAAGFETLEVANGYWTSKGYVGEFDNVAIGEGAALQVNEVDLGDGEGLSSPILTPAVTTNGRLILNFSENDVVSQLDELSITGAGTVELIGEAVFTVDTATVAHTGGTVIANGGLVLTGTLLGDVTTEGDGTFTLGAGGTEGQFAGDLVNNGRFVFNRSDDYDFAGAFSGTGTLDKMGAGILNFTGDYGFDGITNILAGSVRFAGQIDPTTDFNVGGGTLDLSGGDQTIGGLSGGGEATVVIGASTLTVDQEEDSEFAGAIEGEGGFTKTGEGTLNFTGDSSYTGPTAVNGGTLAVNGSIVSDVTVNAGGTLGGNGRVGSTTVGGGGIIAPGNSIGRLTVAGNLDFAAGSIYEVEVNAAGEGDRLDATGTVTIDADAGVAVLAEDGDYAGRTDYVILTGAEGIEGRFGPVTTDLAFLDPLLRYGGNSVTLSLYRNDVDFADVAIGANQAGVAAAVQSRGIDDPLFEAVLAQNASGAQQAFGDLSGEILASTLSGLTDDSRHLRGALLGMVAPEAQGAFIWGSAFGGWGDFDASGGRFGMDTDHKGFVTGVGFGGNGFAAALSAGIGNSDFHLGGRSDRARTDSKYLAAHATYGTGEGMRASFGLAYGWHDIDTTRSVSFAPLAQSLTSSRDGSTLQLFGEVGYDAKMGAAAITPFARLAHVRTKSDAFVETGGNAALALAAAKQETDFLSLGVRARFNAGQPGFQPYVSAAWNRAFDDRGAPVGAAFASGGGSPFVLTGTLIPKSSAEVEAGFDYTSGNFRIGAAYSGTLASDRRTHGARVTASFSF